MQWLMIERDADGGPTKVYLVIDEFVPDDWTGWDAILLEEGQDPEAVFHHHVRQMEDGLLYWRCLGDGSDIDDLFNAV